MMLNSKKAKEMKQKHIQKLIKWFQKEPLFWQPGQKMESLEVSNPIPLCHPFKSDLNQIGNRNFLNLIESRVLKIKIQPEIFSLIKESDQSKIEKAIEGFIIEVLPLVRTALFDKQPMAITSLWIRVRDQVFNRFHFEFLVSDYLPLNQKFIEVPSEDILSESGANNFYGSQFYYAYLSDLVFNTVESLPKIVHDTASWFGIEKDDCLSYQTAMRWICQFSKLNQPVFSGALAEDNKLQYIIDGVFCLTDHNIAKNLIRQGLLKIEDIACKELPLSSLTVFNHFYLTQDKNNDTYLDKIIKEMSEHQPDN